jgi:hypothetical protein
MVDGDERARLLPGWEAQKLEELREKIHADFDGTALREEVLTNPSVRGLYVYAHIPLQPNAVPTRTKPFQMHGGRPEAMKKITKQWVEKGFVERPQKCTMKW